MNSKPILLLLLLAPLVAGCSSLQMAPPDVALVNLEFTDLTVFETAGSFTVRIANENPEPIALTGGSYVLFLNGVKVGKGLSSNRVEVPRLGTSTDKVEIFVNNVRLATQIARLLEEERVTYELRAKLYLEGAFGTRRLRSTYGGTFAFDGEP